MYLKWRREKHLRTNSQEAVQNGLRKQVAIEAPWLSCFTEGQSSPDFRAATARDDGQGDLVLRGLWLKRCWAFLGVLSALLGLSGNDDIEVLELVLGLSFL